MDRQDYQESTKDDQVLTLYRLTQLELQVKAGFDSNKQQLSDFMAEIKHVFATKAEMQAFENNKCVEVESLKQDIAAIQDWLTWITRSILGVIILAVLGVVIKVKL